MRLAVLLALLAAAGGGLWLVHPVARLEAALSRAAGAPVTVGSLDVRPGAALVLVVHDVAVARDWAVLHVPTVEAHVAWSSLLGTIRAAVVLDQPLLTLARPEFSRAAPPAKAGGAGGSAAARPAITLDIHKGRVLLAGMPPVGIDGRIDLSTDPWPLDLTLAGEAGRFRLTGVFDPAGPRTALTLDGALNAPAAAVTAKLSGPLDPLRAVIDLRADLAVVPGAALTGPASLHADVALGEAIGVRDLRLVTPAGIVTGSAEVAQDGRRLRAVLASPRLDLDALRPKLGPAPPAAAPAAGPAPPGPAPPGPAPPVAAPIVAAPIVAAPIVAAPPPARHLPTGVADLRLTATHLLLGGVEYRDLGAHAVLEDGRLAVDPFTATLPGGRLDATLHADPSAVPPTAAVTVHAPAVALARLLGAFGLPDDAAGTAAVEADLHATGTAPASWLASLSGHASLGMGEGELDNRLLGVVFSAIRLPVGVGRTHLRCLALHADLDRGVATLGTLVADTSRLLVEGGGSVDLVRRTLALRLRPLLRAGPGIVLPLRVDGPWEHPAVAPDPAGLARPTADACMAAGLASTPPPPAKPPKPIDLLRSLLR